MLGIKPAALQALRLDADILLEHLRTTATSLPIEPGDEAETIRQCDQINDVLGAVYDYRAALFPRRSMASLADFAPYKRLFAAEDFFELLSSPLVEEARYERLLHCPLTELSKPNFELLVGLCEANFLQSAQLLGLFAVYAATDQFNTLPHRPNLRLVIDNPLAMRQAGLARLAVV